MRSTVIHVLAATALSFAVSAQAGVVRIGQDAFASSAPLITFSEQSVGTPNPTYALAGPLTVNFDGYFVGQRLGTSTECPSVTLPGSCVLGTPRGPLALDSAAPDTRITLDDKTPNVTNDPFDPVLSGSPAFFGPIAILFSQNLAAIGFEGGFFNNSGGTALAAFARDGSLLGQLTNTTIGGFEFLGLATDNGAELIAGVLVSFVGPEDAGFGIDNLRLARRGEVTVPPTNGTPEPGTLLLAGVAVVGMLAARQRRRRS